MYPENKGIQKYFDIISDNEYPEFIDKYLKTKELQKIDKIDFHCGAYYTGAHNIRCWYSRLDHSITCSLLIWHLTKDKTQTLMALFHDLGTPAFSHCVDFLLGDRIHQESSESSVFDIINNSKELKGLLKEDQIEIESFKNIENYPVLENKRPKICIDRFDGVISALYICLQDWELEDVKECVNNLYLIENEVNKLELGFKDLTIAAKYFKGTLLMCTEYQTNHDKYSMQLIADVLQKMINNKNITKDNLYTLSEEDIFKILKEKDKELYNKVLNTGKIIGTNVKPNKYYVSIKTKKMYTIPLVKQKNGNIRITDIDPKYQKQLEEALAFESDEYCHSENIEKL